MIRRIVLAAVVVLFACFGDDKTGAKEQDIPSMHCEADCQCDASFRGHCYACIRFTALNVGDLTPRWEAAVRGKDGSWQVTYKDYGPSVAMAVDQRWTRISMLLKLDGEWVPVCQHMFRRPKPTGPYEHGPYEEGKA